MRVYKNRVFYELLFLSLSSLIISVLGLLLPFFKWKDLASLGIIFSLLLFFVLYINKYRLIIQLNSEGINLYPLLIKWPEIMKIEYRLNKIIILDNKKRNSVIGNIYVNYHKLVKDIYNECIRNNIEECLDQSFINLINNT